VVVFGALTFGPSLLPSALRLAAPSPPPASGGGSFISTCRSVVDAESARIPQTLKDIGGDALEVHLLELFASGRLPSLVLALTWGGSTYAWSSGRVLAPLILGIAGIIGLEVGRWKEVDDFHHNDGVEERGRVSEQSRAAPESRQSPPSYWLSRGAAARTPGALAGYSRRSSSASLPQTLKDIGGDALEVHLLELFASGRLRRLDVEEELG
jgi:hypothetical protein